MNKIKALFFLVFAFVLNASAQTSQLSTEMNAFYEYCQDVRSSVQAQNIPALEKCINDWDGKTYLKYKGVKMNLTTLKVECIDTLGQADVKGHLQFAPAFVDSLIAYGVRLEHFPNIEKYAKKYAKKYVMVTDNDRGPVFYCAYSHVGIRSGQQVTLSIQACGVCELFLMSENGAKITTSIAMEADHKVLLSKTSDAPCFKWYMERGGYAVTIQNPTNMNIGVIIASNFKGF